MTPDPVSAAAPRLDFPQLAAGFVGALAHLDHAATKELDRVGFDAKLRHLVKLRASQINGCAYCVDLHASDARRAGESEQRLTALVVWRDTPFFSARERAALRFTEDVTLMAVDHVPDAAWDAVAEHFGDQEVSALVALIVAINAWNAAGVATRSWVPGSGR